MAIEVSPFDRLPQGDGYAMPSVPDSDSATDNITPSQHVPDSHNSPIQVQVMSVATSSFDGPMNPAPYWNSGHGENVVILDGDK